MNRKNLTRKAALPVAILLVWSLDVPTVAAQVGQKSAAVKHPNLLLNPEEIEQIKLKVKEHAWAARLLDRVKAKAEKDGAAARSGARLRPDGRGQILRHRARAARV